MVRSGGVISTPRIGEALDAERGERFEVLGLHTLNTRIAEARIAEARIAEARIADARIAEARSAEV